MTRTSASLAELVSTLNDGVTFYERAAQKVADPEFVALFERMARLKRTIAGDLKVEIALEGAAPPAEGSLLGSLRIHYAEALAALADHNAATYVARLEEQEDRLMQAFRDGALGADSAKARELALHYYPEVEAMHAEMSRLKKRMA